MRISDWSSDVCSSDLGEGEEQRGEGRRLAHVGPGNRLEPRMMPQCAWPGRARVGISIRAGIREVFLRLCRSRRRTPIMLRSLPPEHRSEEHTSELQSLMRISYAVFCLKNKK